MAPKVTLRWRAISATDIPPRTSPFLAVSGPRAAVLGGEVAPDVLADSALYAIDLEPTPQRASPPSALKTKLETANSLPFRLGASAATVSTTGQIYVWGGVPRERRAIRSAGKDQGDDDESDYAAVWTISPLSDTSPIGWTRLQPYEGGGPVPQPRSYPSLVADGVGALYMHGGIAMGGRPLNDMWAFLLSSGRWIQLSEPPGGPRVGSKLAMGKEVGGKVFRVGGSGTGASNGSAVRSTDAAVEVYDPERDFWTSRPYEAKGISGPRKRIGSGVGFLKFREQEMVVEMLGLASVDDKGNSHLTMLDDVWAWDVQDQLWSRVEVKGVTPSPRAYFGLASVRDDEILLQGGISKDETRLGDVWVAKFTVS